MTTPKMKKVSMSMPDSLVSDLDYVASRLGVSRSALVSQIMCEAMPDMRKLLEMIPPSPTPADLVRYRGESEDVIKARVESLLRSQDDLFSGV